MRFNCGVIEASADYIKQGRHKHLVYIHSPSKNNKEIIKCRKQLCAESGGAGLTCTAGCSTPRRSVPSLQLCVTDAEMLTPDFGELQGRTACQGLNEAQHNVVKRIRSQTPLTFPFTHNAVSIHQHSNCCAGRSRQFEVKTSGANVSGGACWM